MTPYPTFKKEHDFHFKEEKRDNAPFPPWYYETEKKAKEKLARMMQLSPSKKHH